jgi:hypothetical protein
MADLVCYQDLSLVKGCEGNACVLLLLDRDTWARTSLVQYVDPVETAQSRQLIAKALPESPNRSY